MQFNIFKNRHHLVQDLGKQHFSPTKNFDILKKYHQPIRSGIVLDTCDKLRLLNDKAFVMPVGLIGA